ncbi:hypothetical protein [Streptomyces chrestomyceticus]|nr:hypothetical protein [Streptomyces chrestomyceticus]
MASQVARVLKLISPAARTPGRSGKGDTVSTAPAGRGPPES